MAELTLDHTYATAIYEVAAEASKVQEVGEDLLAIREILDKEPEFERFLRSPMFSADEKKEVLGNVFEGHAEIETLHLLYVLADKGRLRYLAGIARAYQKLVDEAAGYEDGEVFSVKPLSEEQMAKLQQQVSKMVGAEVKLTNRLDPSLIGGLKVQVAGKLFDASFKSRLQALRNAIDREDIV